MLHPFRTFVVDDQRSWNGITLLIAALHMAREMERRTDRDAVGLLLPG